MPWLGEDEKGGALKRPKFLNIMRWLLTGKSPSAPSPLEFEVIKPSFEKPPTGKAKLTWIGHSTCLLQVGDFNVLTDAIFSQRCSPVQWAGPKRFVPPACSIEELPAVDLLITSHNHYDHLDYRSAKDIEKLHKPLFACGLGLGSWFHQNLSVDRERVLEFDWWQQKSLFDGRLKLKFVPVQHWSKRSVFRDERRSLWGGFIVEVEGFKFFFNGDTGYSEELYREINSNCGPFDVCAIPIGAYEPRSIMEAQHVNPEESFLIHKRLQSRCSIGIHHGTFILTDEPIHEPAERLKKLSKSNPLSSPFLVVKHGQSVTYDISLRKPIN